MPFRWIPISSNQIIEMRYRGSSYRTPIDFPDTSQLGTFNNSSGRSLSTVVLSQTGPAARVRNEVLEMTLIAEKRYRVVEVLPNSRHRTIDSDLSLLTARSSVALCRQIDPKRPVVIETEDAADIDDSGCAWRHY